MIQHSIFSALNNFIPNNNLIQFVTWRFILRRKIEKQLFHIPIEQWAKISLEVKDHKAHVVLLPGCTIVRDISPVTNISQTIDKLLPNTSYSLL